MSDYFTSYSLKVMMKKDIEDSLKVKTAISCLNTLMITHMGHQKNRNAIEKTPDKTYLYLFQEDGPKDTKTFRKFFKWYRSVIRPKFTQRRWK